jgi:hypothetical protein
VLVGLQWYAFIRRRSGHTVSWKDRPVG